LATFGCQGSKNVPAVQANKTQQVLNPTTSSLFVSWKDSISGVESFVLSKHTAPLQLSFYFTNTSYSNDGRYYWFYCAFPPSLSRILGCIDFLTDEITCFPETQFDDASPMVDLSSGEIYWIGGIGTTGSGRLTAPPALYKKAPGSKSPLIKVNSLNLGLKQFVRTTTHLTFNATKTSVNIDTQYGNEWLVGELPLDGTPFQLWQKFDVIYDHGQFNPVDPDLQLITQEHYVDPLTGKITSYKNRMWLIRKGEEAKPIYEDTYRRVAQHAHEWWSANGKRVYYVDYGLGTEYYDLETKERVNVWPHGTCHSHCDASERYFVGDIGTYKWDTGGCKVVFYNKETGKEINIASNLPVGQYGKRAAPYHADPHPQFCFGDKYICYTTTVLGQQTVAFVPVEQLIRLTSK
jgi:hypothetical protein